MRSESRVAMQKHTKPIQPLQRIETEVEMVMAIFLSLMANFTPSSPGLRSGRRRKQGYAMSSTMPSVCAARTELGGAGVAALSYGQPSATLTCSFRFPGAAKLSFHAYPCLA